MSVVISCPRRLIFEQLPYSRRAERRRGNASARVGNRVSNGISNRGVGCYGTTLADAFDTERVERRGR